MFALMTTHSETLLNAVDPEEVIVVSMRDGRTRAVRPANADELRAEIASTGFGLGFFYFSGALE
jgi:predicted ATPase